MAVGQTSQQYLEERTGWIFNESDRIYTIKLTDAGREFYKHNWQKYRKLYPDIVSIAALILYFFIAD